MAGSVCTNDDVVYGPWPRCARIHLASRSRRTPARDREDPSPYDAWPLAGRAGILREPRSRPVGHRGRRQQALSWPHAGGVERELLPQGVAHVRHLDADGRWFGYRPGYEDLCRLWTTPELRSWYREITVATRELQVELEQMAAQGAKPIDYGLRVRTSPAGLSITAANKMRSAQRVRVSFSGASSESVLFDVRAEVLRRNRDALETLVDAANRVVGNPQDAPGGNYLWEKVPAELILSFFDSYRSDPMAWRVRPSLIKRYIEASVSEGELESWTVALVSSTSPNAHPAAVGGLNIGMTKRSLIRDGDIEQRERELQEEHRYAIRRVLNPPDERLGVDDEQLALALVSTQQHWDNQESPSGSRPTAPAGWAIRAQRRPDQPLLVIYVLDHSDHEEHVDQPMVAFFASFPYSNVAVDAEYAVNQIWNRMAEEGLDDVEDTQ